MQPLLRSNGVETPSRGREHVAVARLEEINLGARHCGVGVQEAVEHVALHTECTTKKKSG